MARFFALTILWICLLSRVCWSAEPVLRDGDRIVFVGDSITGQGGRGTTGWMHLIEEGLHAAHPQWRISCIALGGSGSTVTAWQNVERISRETERELDIPGVKVKATLDGGAEVLVIMLGMNDVISPSLSDRPEDVASWAQRYHDLIDALRQRVHPRVVALATITLATEDPALPKNRLGDLLNTALTEMAHQQNCLVLPTRANMVEILHEGRMWRGDFHVTNDNVHPNLAGHVAIAKGMLRGLGEPDAAVSVSDKYASKFIPADPKPTLARTMTPETNDLRDGDLQSFIIRCAWHGLGMTEKPPPTYLLETEGWKAGVNIPEGGEDRFWVTGSPNRLINTLMVQAGQSAVPVSIPAPWLVAVGIENRNAWPGNVFDAAKGVLPMDASVAAGDIVSLPASVSWHRHYASVDHVGGSDPASVDFWAHSIGRLGEAGYGLRWIYSPKQRAVQLQLGSRTFAGNIGLTVWLNQQQVYAKLITSEPKKKITLPSALNEGWNCLAFKCNHLQWQWQVDVGVAGVDSDDLADLRYSTSPKH